MRKWERKRKCKQRKTRWMAKNRSCAQLFALPTYHNRQKRVRDEKLCAKNDLTLPAWLHFPHINRLCRWSGSNHQQIPNSTPLSCSLPPSLCPPLSPRPQCACVATETAHCTSWRTQRNFSKKTKRYSRQHQHVSAPPSPSDIPSSDQAPHCSFTLQLLKWRQVNVFSIFFVFLFLFDKGHAAT